MSVTIRQASSDDLGIIHDIRRDAILGIESDDFGVIERQRWADRRSPEFFAERVAAGDVVLAISESNEGSVHIRTEIHAKELLPCFC